MYVLLLVRLTPCLLAILLLGLTQQVSSQTVRTTTVAEFSKIDGNITENEIRERAGNSSDKTPEGPLIIGAVQENATDSILSGLEVVVNKCPGAGIEASYFQVPSPYQAPLSHLKKDRIGGRFKNGLYNFTLVDRVPACADEGLRWDYTFSSPEQILVDRQNFSGKSRDVQYSFFGDLFTPYGDLKGDPQTFQYPPSSYCISTLTEETLGFSLCDPLVTMATNKEPSTEMQTAAKPDSFLIRKCCPLGMVLRLNIMDDKELIGCVESYEEEWTPYFYRKFTALSKGFGLTESPIDGGVNGAARPYYDHTILNCNGSLSRFLSDERAKPAETVAEIRVLESGEILTRASGQHEWDKLKQTGTSSMHIMSSNMCIDGTINTGDGATTFTRSPANQIILYCKVPEDDSELYVYSTIYFSMFCITSVFLAVVLVVYALIWKSQNIHGWTSAAFTLFVFFYHLSSAVFQGATVFSQQKIILFNSPACVTIGIVNLYSYIAMFSWMTILNFDLWVTISSMTPVSNRSKGTKRFLAYCCFSLGVPLLVVGIAMGIELGFGLFDERVVRPLIGRFACAVDNTAYIFYHSIPSLIIFLVNVVFAVLTIVSLYTWKKDTKRINKSNSKASQSQAKLMCKLFVLMGFSWIFDIVSWFVESNSNTWYLAVFDMFNILQALALFWIFVCKKEVKDDLCNNYEVIKRCIVWVEKKTEGLYGSSSALHGATATHSTSVNTTGSQSVADNSVSHATNA